MMGFSTSFATVTQKCISWCLAFAILQCILPSSTRCVVTAFTSQRVVLPTTYFSSASRIYMASESSISTDGTSIPTLTEDTTWRLRFSLNSVPTSNGKKVGELFVVDVQFIEEEGYEPPQGNIIQIRSNQQPNVQYLNVKSGRWKLSEDPNDRKDGLWVWGLFQEPLYPFMLLQIETDAFTLPSVDGEEADSIEPLTLYAQINHKRDRDTGRVELEAASLNIREVESLKADPFGAARVDVFEDVKVGQLSLRPLDAGEKSDGVNNALL